MASLVLVLLDGEALSWSLLVNYGSSGEFGWFLMAIVCGFVFWWFSRVVLLFLLDGLINGGVSCGATLFSVSFVFYFLFRFCFLVVFFCFIVSRGV